MGTQYQQWCEVSYHHNVFVVIRGRGRAIGADSEANVRPSKHKNSVVATGDDTSTVFVVRCRSNIDEFDTVQDTIGDSNSVEEIMCDCVIA